MRSEHALALVVALNGLPEFKRIGREAIYSDVIMITDAHGTFYTSAVITTFPPNDVEDTAIRAGLGLAEMPELTFKPFASGWIVFNTPAERLPLDTAPSPDAAA